MKVNSVIPFAGERAKTCSSVGLVETLGKLRVIEYVILSILPENYNVL